MARRTKKRTDPDIAAEPPRVEGKHGQIRYSAEPGTNLGVLRRILGDFWEELKGEGLTRGGRLIVTVELERKPGT